MVAYQIVLVALGNPTRCLILECLRGGPLTVGEIAKKIPVTRPAVSQHLKMLKKGGFGRRLGIRDSALLPSGRAWIGGATCMARAIPAGRARRWRKALLSSAAKEGGWPMNNCS